jgi:hypothetical protein
MVVSLTDAEVKLKRILDQLNKTEIPLNIFYIQLEKEFGNTIPFSKLKDNLENFYVTISKSKSITVYYIYIYV